ncbi:hypothetical protein [Jannaschia marina]|uniref:hypothetical protein n=1 Tax=Jannaschia marina TaxID=2741674 RepID=UPI0015C95CEB|nr:hypothetical protein [Jannaschia marina]
MKLTPSIAMIAAIGIAGCVETTSAGDAPFVRVTDGAAFSAATVGRKIVNVSDGDARFFRLNADGTMGGTYGNGPLAGTWSFDGGYWCRTWTAGLKPESLNRRDCQLAELRPGQVRLTRDRGNGNSGTFNLR